MYACSVCVIINGGSLSLALSVRALPSYLNRCGGGSSTVMVPSITSMQQHHCKSNVFIKIALRNRTMFVCMRHNCVVLNAVCRVRCVMMPDNSRIEFGIEVLYCITTHHLTSMCIMFEFHHISATPCPCPCVPRRA